MLIKKIAIIGLAIGLTACSTTEMVDPDIANLNQRVSNLSTKIDALSKKLADIESNNKKAVMAANEAKTAAEQAALEAKDANERVNNMVSSYKK